MLNRDLAQAVARQGRGDQLLACGAGTPWLKSREVALFLIIMTVALFLAAFKTGVFAGWRNFEGSHRHGNRGGNGAPRGLHAIRAGFNIKSERTI